MQVSTSKIKNAESRMVQQIKSRAEALEHFAQKTPDSAMDTANELVVSGLAAQHFTILPKSEVILDVDGLYKIVIVEDEEDAVVCQIYFNHDDLIFASVLIFKHELDISGKDRTLVDEKHHKRAVKSMFSERFAFNPHELPEKIKSFFCLLCAVIVRDFWVLEDKARHRVYQKKTQKIRERVGTGKDRHLVVEKIHRYIPRVRYDLSAYEGTDSKISEEVRITLSPHLVSGHLRRLPEGHKPSEQAKQHAQDFGITLAPGHTFVRPHRKNEVEQMRTYRSRSALKLIFEISDTAESKTL